MLPAFIRLIAIASCSLQHARKDIVFAVDLAKTLGVEVGQHTRRSPLHKISCLFVRCIFTASQCTVFPAAPWKPINGFTHCTFYGCPQIDTVPLHFLPYIHNPCRSYRPCHSGNYVGDVCGIVRQGHGPGPGGRRFLRRV